MSPNYFKTHDDQTVLLDAFLKPVHSILIVVQPHQIEAILLSEDDISKYSEGELASNEWIICSNGMVLKGIPNRLSVKDQEGYQKLLEQARFFGGHFKELIEQKEQYAWLHLSTNEKLTLFETYLSAYRENCRSDVKQIKIMFSEKPKAIKFLFENAFKDLSAIKWELQFKELGKSDINLLMQLGKEVNLASKNMINQDLQDLEKRLIQSFPFQSEEIKTHFSLLNQIKRLVCEALISVEPFNLSPYTSQDQPDILKNFFHALTEIHQNLDHIDLSSEKQTLISENPFLSNSPIFEQYFEKIQRIHDVIKDVPSCLLPLLEQLIQEKGLPESLIIKILMEAPSYSETILQFVALLTERQILELCQKNKPNFESIDILMKANPHKFNKKWLESLLLATPKDHPHLQDIILKTHQKGLDFNQAICNHIADVITFDTLYYLQPSAWDSLLEELFQNNPSKFIELYIYAQDKPNLLQSVISVLIYNDSNLEEFKSRLQPDYSPVLLKELNEVCLQHFSELEHVPLSIKIKLRRLSLDKIPFSIKDKIAYFSEHPQEFTHFMLKIPLNTDLIIEASKKSTLTPQVLVLLQDKEFQKKQHFETILEHPEINKMHRLAKSFEHYSKTFNLQGVEDSYLEPIRPLMDKLLALDENMLDPNLDIQQLQDDLKRQYPSFIPMFDIHFEQSNHVCLILSKLIKDNDFVPNEEETQAIENFYQCKFANFDKRPIFNKIQWIQLLLDQNIPIHVNIKNISFLQNKEIMKCIPTEYQSSNILKFILKGFFPVLDIGDIINICQRLSMEDIVECTSNHVALINKLVEVNSLEWTKRLIQCYIRANQNYHALLEVAYKNPSFKFDDIFYPNLDQIKSDTFEWFSEHQQDKLDVLLTKLATSKLAELFHQAGPKFLHQLILHCTNNHLLEDPCIQQAISTKLNTLSWNDDLKELFDAAPIGDFKKNIISSALQVYLDKEIYSQGDNIQLKEICSAIMELETAQIKNLLSQELTNNTRIPEAVQNPLYLLGKHALYLLDRDVEKAKSVIDLYFESKYFLANHEQSQNPLHSFSMIIQPHEDLIFKHRNIIFRLLRAIFDYLNLTFSSEKHWGFFKTYTENIVEDIQQKIPNQKN